MASESLASATQALVSCISTIIILQNRMYNPVFLLFIKQVKQDKKAHLSYQQIRW